MKVDLIDWMGDDLTVVNAARVSMNKESAYMNEGDNSLEWTLQDKDVNLIRYLAKHKHWTPFAHPQITVRVEAPVFVRVQCYKHKVGFTENEISRRYVNSTPTYHIPTRWRKVADNIKQGSSDVEVTIAGLPQEYKDLMDDCVDMYEYMITEGVCAEQARMVLPQSMNTEWYWTGSLAAFARFYVQRTHETSQKETSFIAEECGRLIAPLFPESWKALVNKED